MIISNHNHPCGFHDSESAKSFGTLKKQKHTELHSSNFDLEFRFKMSTRIFQDWVRIKPRQYGTMNDNKLFIGVLGRFEGKGHR